MRERVKARAETSGRADDNATAMEKRLKTFNDSNKEVIDHLAGNFFKEVSKFAYLDWEMLTWIG